MRRSRLQSASGFLWILLLYREFDLCASLNAEGRALLRFRERVELDPYNALADWDEGNGLDPCFWFGVKCSDDGRVVSLNLKDLCLKGTLARELGKLIHMKSIILHNNSFSGIIPREIGELQNLEILDLGHNNLSGPLPSELGSVLSLEILVLRNNRFIDSISQELHVLNMLSDLQIDDGVLASNRRSVKRKVGDATIRKLLQLGNKDKGRRNKNGRNQTHSAASPAPTPAPYPSHKPPKHQLPPSISPLFSPFHSPGVSPFPENHPKNDAALPSTSVLFPPPSESRSPLVATGVEVKRTNDSWKIYGSIALGVSFLLALTAVYILCCRANKVTVRPWATGLSGQLQKAFVTGVPSLKRSELETACEDFSNIIGSLSDCKLYKGTLSSGVEIAVASSLITSAKDWSKQSESQFRKKISMLSKVNHKNFMNLLGYCEEGEPFTRMMVFEYASNGTLFEHLHIKEAEPLDWAARLRVAMGVAYCLEHMHRINPPLVLRNLDSSFIYLTDDYAAKISDLGFWDAAKESEPDTGTTGPVDEPLLDSESIVYKFGIILLELLSGRRPFSKDDSLMEHWASSYLSGKRPLINMIDPILKSLHDEEIGALCGVIRSCIDPDPKERPTMAEVARRLRDITAMAPEGATPKLSPLWWAELEILSSEAN